MKCNYCNSDYVNTSDGEHACVHHRGCIATCGTLQVESNCKCWCHEPEPEITQPSKLDQFQKDAETLGFMRAKLSITGYIDKELYNLNPSGPTEQVLRRIKTFVQGVQL